MSFLKSLRSWSHDHFFGLFLIVNAIFWIAFIFCLFKYAVIKTILVFTFIISPLIAILTCVVGYNVGREAEERGKGKVVDVK